jgi:hypothetical protein
MRALGQRTLVLSPSAASRRLVAVPPVRTCHLGRGQRSAGWLNRLARSGRAGQSIPMRVW